VFRSCTRTKAKNTRVRRDKSLQPIEQPPSRNMMTEKPAGKAGFFVVDATGSVEQRRRLLSQTYIDTIFENR
jgi:hypothetical protein